MNPLRLRASAFRSYPELDLTFPEGCVAVTGPNGSGKSSLIAALDVALFGGRNLADYLSDDGDSDAMWVELTFTHSDATYRVRRTFSAKGRGKSTTDFEKAILHPDAVGGADPEIFIPLTRETQAATQEAIEEVLGLSRETLRASALLMQGEGGVWTEAKPAERKAVLAEILGLASWDRFRDAASSDRRHAERLRNEQDGRIELLAERGGDVAVLGEAKLRAEEVVAYGQQAHGVQEVELTAAAEKVTAIERSESEYVGRKAAYDAARSRLDAHAQIAEDAVEATSLAAAVQGELAALPTEAQMQKAILDETELRRGVEVQRENVAAWTAAKGAHQAALLRRNDHLGRASTLNEEAHALREQAEHVVAHIGEARCDRCEQVLGEEAALIAARSLGDAADAKDREASALDELAKAIELPEIGEEPVFDAALASEHARTVGLVERTRSAYMQRPRLEERLAGYDRQIAAAQTPEYRVSFDALKQAALDAASGLDEIDEPEPGALDAARVAAVTAKASLDIAARSLTEAREALIRADSALEQARASAEELAAARIRRDELAAEIELLSTLERAYGRDGIPALIVEASAIPQIEANADRFLAALGTEFRVELRTQRALKSGDGLADTLDVTVITPAGERAFETFSGSEQERISIALRLALADLLAHRRGADSRIVVLDEPEGLDDDSSARLVDLLLGLYREGRFESVYMVSHHPSLRDVFDNVIAVEKVDGRSRIAA